MKLKEFVRKFVCPNEEIQLSDWEEYKRRRAESYKQNKCDFEIPLIWEGMEWQIILDPKDPYYAAHPDVKPFTEEYYVNRVQTSNKYGDYSVLLLQVTKIEN